MHRLCTGGHSWLWWLSKTKFSLPSAAEMVGTSLSQREHVVRQESKAVLYVIRHFCVTPSLWLLYYYSVLKPARCFSPIEIIEEKQFPTGESTPLISLGPFCTLSILLLHFISPLPCSGNQSCCGQIKTTVLHAHTFSHVCKTYALYTSSSFSVPDGGIGWCPAEQPSDCQHPGHRRQWQHAHIYQGLLQCWGLHRHAAGGNCSPGNRMGKCSSSPTYSLGLSLFVPTAASTMLPFMLEEHPTRCVDRNSFLLIHSHDSRVKKDASLRSGNPRRWAAGTI